MCGGYFLVSVAVEYSLPPDPTDPIPRGPLHLTLNGVACLLSVAIAVYRQRHSHTHRRTDIQTLSADARAIPPATSSGVGKTTGASKPPPIKSSAGCQGSTCSKGSTGCTGSTGSKGSTGRTVHKGSPGTTGNPTRPVSTVSALQVSSSYLCQIHTHIAAAGCAQLKRLLSQRARVSSDNSQPAHLYGLAAGAQLRRIMSQCGRACSQYLQPARLYAFATGAWLARQRQRCIVTCQTFLQQAHTRMSSAAAWVAWLLLQSCTATSRALTEARGGLLARVRALAATPAASSSTITTTGSSTPSAGSGIPSAGNSVSSTSRSSTASRGHLPSLPGMDAGELQHLLLPEQKTRPPIFDG